MLLLGNICTQVSMVHGMHCMLHALLVEFVDMFGQTFLRDRGV